MRATSCMDDVSEVIFGLNRVKGALNSPQGQFFRTALDNVHPNTSDKINSLFTDDAPLLWGNTYLTCVCEHDPKEDVEGNLPMLRTFGKSTAVALILEPDVFLQKSYALGCYASPVIYPAVEEIESQLQEIGKNIEASKNLKQGYKPEDFLGHVRAALTFAILSTKHRSFRGEQEWRVICCPSFLNRSDLRALWSASTV